jgi:hypothetical protein
MAEDDRTFRTSTPAANRAEMQGLGVGQKEMDAQQAPNRDHYATDPQRLEPFENDAAGTRDDRGQPREETSRPFDGPGSNLDDRNAAGLDDAGDLGASTPPNVDVHDLGQEDNPQEDWGEDADAQMLHSTNHTRRPVKTEAERGQGAKTRRANKDIVSRRT